MKITPVNNAHLVNSVKKAQSAYSAADETNISKQDEVSLSETAQVFANATKSVKEQIMDSVARQQKIDRIKAQIEAGTYNIDSRAVAAKILGAVGEGEY